MCSIRSLIIFATILTTIVVTDYTTTGQCDFETIKKKSPAKCKLDKIEPIDLEISQQIGWNTVGHLISFAPGGGVARGIYDPFSPVSTQHQLINQLATKVNDALEQIVECHIAGVIQDVKSGERIFATDVTKLKSVFNFMDTASGDNLATYINTAWTYIVQFIDTWYDVSAKNNNNNNYVNHYSRFFPGFSVVTRIFQILSDLILSKELAQNDCGNYQTEVERIKKYLEKLLKWEEKAKEAFEWSIFSLKPKEMQCKWQAKYYEYPKWSSFLSWKNTPNVISTQSEYNVFAAICCKLDGLIAQDLQLCWGGYEDRDMCQGRRWDVSITVSPERVASCHFKIPQDKYAGAPGTQKKICDIVKKEADKLKTKITNQMSSAKWEEDWNEKVGMVQMKMFKESLGDIHTLRLSKDACGKADPKNQNIKPFKVEHMKNLKSVLYQYENKDSSDYTYSLDDNSAVLKAKGYSRTIIEHVIPDVNIDDMDNLTPLRKFYNKDDKKYLITTITKKDELADDGYKEVSVLGYCGKEKSIYKGYTKPIKFNDEIICYSYITPIYSTIYGYQKFDKSTKKLQTPTSIVWSSDPKSAISRKMIKAGFILTQSRRILTQSPADDIGTLIPLYLFHDAQINSYQMRTSPNLICECYDYETKFEMNRQCCIVVKLHATRCQGCYRNKLISKLGYCYKKSKDGWNKVVVGTNGKTICYAKDDEEEAELVKLSQYKKLRKITFSTIKTDTLIQQAELKLIIVGTFNNDETLTKIGYNKIADDGQLIAEVAKSSKFAKTELVPLYRLHDPHLNVDMLLTTDQKEMENAKDKYLRGYKLDKILGYCSRSYDVSIGSIVPIIAPFKIFSDPKTGKISLVQRVVCYGFCSDLKSCINYIH